MLLVGFLGLWNLSIFWYQEGSRELRGLGLHILDYRRGDLGQTEEGPCMIFLSVS